MLHVVAAGARWLESLRKPRYGAENIWGCAFGVLRLSGPAGSARGRIECQAGTGDGSVPCRADAPDRGARRRRRCSRRTTAQKPQINPKSPGALTARPLECVALGCVSRLIAARDRALTEAPAPFQRGRSPTLRLTPARFARKLIRRPFGLPLPWRPRRVAQQNSSRGARCRAMPQWRSTPLTLRHCSSWSRWRRSLRWCAKRGGAM